jgi:hypothetical protein
LDAQRLAFLEVVKADLTSAKDSSPTAGPPTRNGGKTRAAAAAIFAGASFFTMSATGAAAATAGTEGTQTVLDCPGPSAVAYTHYKGCGSTTQKFEYIYRYSPNQAVFCYVFDASMLTCNQWYPNGRVENCST